MTESVPATSNGLIVEEDDSQWEYEYHEIETESFYVTLDLSSESSAIRSKKDAEFSETTVTPVSAQSAVHPPKRVNFNPSLRKTRKALRANLRIPSEVIQFPGDTTDNIDNPVYSPIPNVEANTFVKRPQESLSIVPKAPTSQAKLQADLPMTSHQTELAPRSTEAPPSAESAQENLQDSPEPEDLVQILDLHTRNPLISYQKQTYSCTWTSTIGTDLLLTRPDLNFAHPILQKSPTLNVLAATGIKLIGRPVRVVPHHEERTNEARIRAALSVPVPETSEPQGAEEEVEGEAEAEAECESGRPVSIPVDAGSAKTRHNQAKFLERLISIKAARGEKDQVTVYARKVNTGTGWRSQQLPRGDNDQNDQGDTMMMDDDTGNDDYDDDDPATLRVRPRTPPIRGKTGRPRGKNVMKVRAMGGLFRDYRPKVLDKQGADIRGNGGMDISTSERLEDLNEGEGTEVVDSGDELSTGTSGPAPAERSSFAAAVIATELTRHMEAQGKGEDSSPTLLDPTNSGEKQTSTAPPCPSNFVRSASSFPSTRTDIAMEDA